MDGEEVTTYDRQSTQLTDREIEVLQLILKGKSSKEAAVLLCCSKRTVDFHLARVYQKLDVSNRVQAMRYAAILGLIPESSIGDVVSSHTPVSSTRSDTI